MARAGERAAGDTPSLASDSVAGRARRFGAAFAAANLVTLLYGRC